MNPETWKKISEIYYYAVELEPAQRKVFLDERCGEDEFLRAEVESLLSADEKAGDFIEQPVIEDFAEFLEDEDETALNGKHLGNYKIVSHIGSGGMGKVYLAEDLRLKRPVAIKTLPRFLSERPKDLRRFETEAIYVSALNHPNILTVYEISDFEGIRFIAAEYVEGKTLREEIEHKTLDLQSILKIAVQIASALSVAHEKGIIHRDIKPENIMVRDDGFVKVLDFGLAKLTDSEQILPEDKTLAQSIPGLIRGTVAYMSPEQARGLKLDARTDVWSFGVVLFEMLAGSAPFSGETAIDVMLSIIQNEPENLRNIAPDLPEELHLIVNKLLRKNLDERYQKIEDALNALRLVLQKIEFEAIGRALLSVEQKGRTEEIKQNTTNFAPLPNPSNESVSKTTEEKTTPSNLSAELSPLIGRETELQEIKTFLFQPEVRLLTITGVGGTGKTRLAKAVARESLAEFTDGVYFINLSAIANAELVVPVIAYTLGIREESGKSLKENLLEFIGEKKILLVLDNFEQITEAASQIGEILSGSAKAKILATSRVRLNLRFEREFPLKPLNIPRSENLSTAELSEFPAIALFVERARAVKPVFELKEENAQTIAQICRRLDGLPLAIELAAVRVKMLAPQAILSRLSNSLSLLTGGARDLPERQQTMRAAIAWSYDLLEPEERKLFSRIAVFSGGFTLESVEKISDSNNDLCVEILDGIASLVDKNLLTQREMPDGEPRFRMLGVIREFALETLEESGEANEIKLLHAQFFASLAEKAEPELRGENVARWLEILEREHDNLRSALEWSLEHEPESALRIVGAIRSFWIRRGYLSEAGKWTKQALEKAGATANPKLRAKAFLGLGSFKRFLGDLKAAERFLEESLPLTREIGDKYLMSVAVGDLGLVKFLQDDFSSGKALMEESLSIARALDERKLISIRLTGLGEIARRQKDYESAKNYYEEALNIAREESSKYLIPVYTFNLASVACLQEDYEKAFSYARESLESSEELEDKISIADALNIFAALSVAEGKMNEAARLWGAAQNIYEATGFKLEKVDREFSEHYQNKARASIGDESFETAFKEGRSMRLKKALGLAREIDQSDFLT
jgi:non-specific serine/threonine protein kinase